MKALPYFKWYPADADTDQNFRAMDDADIGFYIRCLNHAWMNGGIPADPKERARVLRTRLDTANKRWERVGKCFVTSTLYPDSLINLRQEAERELASQKSQLASESAKVGSERRAKASRHALARADYDYVSSSDVVSLEESVRETTLTARYKQFIADWTKPTEDGRRFTCADVDLGCQVWMSLIDKGTITEANVGEIFEGLERHRQSKKWNEGFVLSVPAFLGWAKNGTPAAPRWNDRPEPNSDGGY